jgi:hypothetical protein
MAKKHPRRDDGFPRSETFTDCCGRNRQFTIELRTTPGGHFLTAKEAGKPPGGYEFGAYAEADPYIALGRLRDKIRKGLSTRYLIIQNGRRLPSHNVLKGHVGYGGFVIDGEFVPFDEFVAMVQAFEGHQFSLQLADPFDAI